jgi:hypothetical protein
VTLCEDGEAEREKFPVVAALTTRVTVAVCVRLGLLLVPVIVRV